MVSGWSARSSKLPYTMHHCCPLGQQLSAFQILCNQGTAAPSCTSFATEAALPAPALTRMPLPLSFLHSVVIGRMNRPWCCPTQAWPAKQLCLLQCSRAHSDLLPCPSGGQLLFGPGIGLQVKPGMWRSC